MEKFVRECSNSNKIIMEKVESTFTENAITVLNEISKLVQDIENKVSVSNIKAKECEELKILKKKCCDKNPITSLSGFHGIKYLVERKILIGSQTISMLVSLLPSVNQYGALICAIGDILLIDLQAQLLQTGEYKCPYGIQVQHPFIIVLKYNWEKSWFEIYHFVLQLMENNEDMQLEHKIKFLRPIFRQLYWSSSWRGTLFHLKLFNMLMLESHEKEIMNFAVENLLWQELDIHYCLFLQDLFTHLLRKSSDRHKTIVCGMTPSLAQAIKWLIVNGYNPGSWFKLLRACLEVDAASGSAVLFTLTDAIMETPSVYINPLVGVCKSIIFSTNCNKYVAYKFVAVMLNWFVSPSFLANPLYRTLEEVIDFITGGTSKWSDQTLKLNENEYYKAFGNSKMEVKFAVDLILASNRWSEEETLIADWLKNLSDSDKHEIQLRLHSFIHGIVLCEKNAVVINLCLDILFKLMERHKEISFSLLCLLFYKLGRERDPSMQKMYLFSLPKLSVKKMNLEYLQVQCENCPLLKFYGPKENIPLIVGIIESLKRGNPRVMTPLVVQLYLVLWKFDNRTYSYLHKMLHDSSPGDFSWELNVSKAIALKEICRLAPHLHAKDLVGVLSKILNECSGGVSGLPSAIAIEAVTDLCKAYVIDVSGTWNAIQPKLRMDKRPKVIKSLCRFFGDIPNLNSSELKNEELTKDIVLMLWNYTSFNDAEVVRIAFRALSNFPIESLPLKLLPENYRVNLKLPKELEKNSKSPEDLLNFPYVSAECWIQFLEKINEEVLSDGGSLIIAFVERELSSLPRGIFYLPPERPEPLNYSYLPSRSICRCLVEFLQKHSRDPGNRPEFLKEIVRILSFEFTKVLPPLNWGFLERLVHLDWNFSCHCLALLAKQGHASASAKSILDNYFRCTEWDDNKLEEILFIYNKLPLLCRSLGYNILQAFLEGTIRLCLETSLNRKTLHFEKVLRSLTETLRNKTVQPSHKKLIVKKLERILILIPPENELMKKYAMCATEFPVQAVEELTSIKDLSEVGRFWLRRAVTIRCAIAMRSDIKNPLVWLNEFTEAVAHFPEEQNFVLNNIWFILRSRRSCDHRNWVQELTWRIQASIASTTRESKTVTLFLVDVFITVVVILSGYDYLFMGPEEFTTENSKKLDIFPHALCFLFSLPEWNDMLPKVGLWLQKLLKWKYLPEDRIKVIIQALLMLREVKYSMNENELSFVFNMLPLPFE